MGAPLGSGIGYCDSGKFACLVCAAKDKEIDRLRIELRKARERIKHAQFTAKDFDEETERLIAAEAAEEGE